MSDIDLYLNQEEFENVFKKHIKASSYSLSIKTLFGERMSRKINYHPYYQRNYVWDNSKASFFIESVLLGTDIPPLIFFNTGSKIEVIDGRQHFETIKKFKSNDFKLNIKGLTKLTQLQNHSFSRLDGDIQDLLDNAKIRVFEFEVINEPRMDSHLEDKIKKEIFRRYNSGITPLNSAEIDNATYDDDELTNKLKSALSNDSELVQRIKDKFVGVSRQNNDHSKVLQFLRRYLVLASFPINTYATGSNRTEILDLLYGVKANNTEDEGELCDFLIDVLTKTINFVDSLSIENNKLVNEAVLWALFVLSEEDVVLDKLESQEFIDYVSKEISKSLAVFASDNSHHYRSIIDRHKYIGDLFGKYFDFDFSLFIKNDDFKNQVKDMRQSEKEAKLKLSELASLRVQRPDPSLIPVEEIVSDLGGRRFCVRPSYQRQEKINVTKASAIIESIILSINLPPLFIFNNKDNVKEVIDGQQRLLSILGFLGKPYMNERGKTVYPKLNGFKLKSLKILKEFNGKKFSDLDYLIQDKILDFKLSVIEIDSALNGNFDPVDLFIRLNNKPYPIKENSFEMWNSFVDKDVIRKIKDITDESIDWFFIKQRSSKSSDRMQNEELVTLLSYISYNDTYRSDYTSLGFYLRDNSISCRITDKKDVSSLLEKISTDVELKRAFMKSVLGIGECIKLLQSKLDQDDQKQSLTDLISRGTSKRYLVDFYLLFQILQRMDNVRKNKITYSELQKKMREILGQFKDPSHIGDDVSPQHHFENYLNEISK